MVSQSRDSVRSATPTSVQNPLPKASGAESVQILRDVQLPMVAKGPIVRRPKIVGAVERLGLEGRAVRRMQTLSEKYARGPVMLSGPKKMAVVLDPDHVHRILDETPEPFATAETLKRQALTHFEPKVALISHGTERAERRRLNEEVLGADDLIHPWARQLLPIVEEEAAGLLDTVAQQGGTLDWTTYINAWFRVVRRVVLGDSAREDTELTELIEKLRSRGNWASFRPVNRSGRKELLEGIDAALDRAEPGSLAAYMAEVAGRRPQQEDSQPAHQIPQWLFAFDPAGMASFRALALLGAHPDRLDSVRLQIAAESEESVARLELLRATLLESLRLWPTTPLVLRETTQEVEFEYGVMPAGTSVLIFAPFFHRDERRLDFAHRFSPELWEQERTQGDWPLVPFSLGPGICPGRHLVALLTSHFLARIVEEHDLELTSHRLQPGDLPSLLNNYRLAFRLR